MRLARSLAELSHNLCVWKRLLIFLHVANLCALFATPLCMISNTPLKENFKHSALFRHQDVCSALKEHSLPSRKFPRQIQPSRQSFWGFVGVCYSATFSPEISAIFHEYSILSSVASLCTIIRHNITWLMHPSLIQREMNIYSPGYFCFPRNHNYSCWLFLHSCCILIKEQVNRALFSWTLLSYFSPHFMKPSKASPFYAYMHY